MRIFITLFGLSTLTLFSCQKESDFANRTSSGGSGGGGNTSNPLLVKMVQTAGADSVVTTFGYDANKKLVSLKKMGIDDQGDPVNSEYHFHRNAAGVMTDWSVISAELLAGGIDSLTTIVHYNSSTLRYTSYVINWDLFGFNIRDSSIFVYDGSGKITIEKVYESPSGTGNDYFLSGTINYTYSAPGNISRFEIHDFDASGAEIFTATATHTFDAKTNPLQLGNEALLLQHPEWANVNNITKAQSSDSNGPADDQTYNISYTYNPDQRPQSTFTVVIPDNTTSYTAYYYQ